MSSVPQPFTPKRTAKMPSNHSLNVNDLLNFTLPPRQARPLTSLPRRSRKTGTHQGVWNKERFVNAQYRFVVNPTGDYTVHFADPDIFFQWHDILQVVIPRASALASAAAGSELNSQNEGLTTCPICLSPPTAPRMTKCGHVYCFPCILRYLSTSDNKWARCPICFDSVNEKQLKSVKWYDGPSDVVDGPRGDDSSSSSTSDTTLEATPRAGSTIRMRLMQRPQITTLALPRSRTWPSDLLPPHQAPFHFLPDVFSFAKFMLATPTYLISELTRDLDELTLERRVLASMDDVLGTYFIDGAEQKVRAQMAKAAALETPPLAEKIDKAVRDHREIEERFAFYDRRRKAEEAALPQPIDIPDELLAIKSSGHFVSPDPTPKPSAPLNKSAPRQRRNINPPPPSTSTYYYYQASSGLPLFLHPLDIKILLAHFNGYPSFPDTITIRVESFSEGTVNDDLRKRCKYLAHMPEGADVVFIEADLEEAVGAEGLKNFVGALKMRTSRRNEKGKKDNRARARAEEREREKERNTIVRTDVFHTPSFVASDLSTADLVLQSEDPVQVLPPPSGAWGARSFASALHSAPAQGSSQRPVRREVEEDEWDVDVAWHELEQRSGGHRKKRGPKLVVLGGGGGGRRR